MYARVCGLTITFLAATSPADAQIIQAVNRFTNPGEPEVQTNEAAEANEDDQGLLFLSQASAQGIGTDKAQIALQALDLWLSRKSRLYARLTLPLKSEPAAEPTSDGESGTGDAPVKPSDGIVKQLVDPYGGIFNLSGGVFTRLGRRDTLTHQEQRVAGVARGLRSELEPKERQKLAVMQPEHGAFLDIRGGFKLIDLPNAGERAVAIGDSKLNVFYSGIAGLKVIAPLYKRPVNDDEATKEDLAGGVTLGAYIVGNHAADETQSDIFTTALNKSTAAFTAVIGVNLPGIAGITFSMTPWTSDERMGKVFVFGFDVLRPTQDQGQ